MVFVVGAILLKMSDLNITLRVCTLLFTRNCYLAEVLNLSYSYLKNSENFQVTFHSKLPKYEIGYCAGS